MPCRVKLKKLGECASDSIFEEIKAKINAVFSSNNEEADFTARKNQVVNSVREKIKEYFVGPFSQARHKLLQRFVNSFNFDSPSPNLDYCYTFFCCLLDVSFKVFSLTDEDGYHDDLCGSLHPFQSMDSVVVLSILKKYSPFLESVILSFRFVNCQSVPFNPAISIQLSSLECLTSLKISWNTAVDADTLPFFVSLGTCCPKLSILHLNSLRFGTEQLLALLLGSQHALIPPYLLKLIRLDGGSAHLEFAQENLTPICSSLKVLKHRQHNESEMSDDCSSWKYCVVLAFRHLRLSETLNHECLQSFCDTSNAVKRFHQEQQLARHMIEIEAEDVITTCPSAHLLPDWDRSYIL